jgi:hypothetical protein
MIVTGMVLLAVGTADVARQFLRGRILRLVLAVGALAIVVVGILTAAPLAGLLAVAVSIAWVWLFPLRGRARAGFWPAVALALMCIVFIAVLGPREDAGVLGAVWSVPTPWGPLSVDHTLLVVGALCILLESGNVIVRAALTSEMPAMLPAISAPTKTTALLTDAAVDTASDTGPATAPDITTAIADGPGPDIPTPTPTRTMVPVPTLKGGRLIGPLERVIVFALTLTGVYSLLAAVLAAKGIVRFPEISRDGDTGSRAEYFLIGSLVSWVIALAAAFLVWWGLADVV